MFGIIAGVLLALLAAGLIATLFVKLTTTVGRYIMMKVRENRRKRALTTMKGIITEMNNEAKNDQRNKIKHELNDDDLLMWEQDDNEEVIEETIELIHADQVDAKTRNILKAHDDLVYITPTAV